MIKNDAQKESTSIKKPTKCWSKIDAKIDAKIYAKRHPKKKSGGRGVTPLSSTQSLYLVTCFSDSYINHQPNPQNGPSAPLRGCAAGFKGYRLCRRPLRKAVDPAYKILSLQQTQQRVRESEYRTIQSTESLSILESKSRANWQCRSNRV